MTNPSRAVVYLIPAAYLFAPHSQYRLYYSQKIFASPTRISKQDQDIEQILPTDNPSFFGGLNRSRFQTGAGLPVTKDMKNIERIVLVRTLQVPPGESWDTGNQTVELQGVTWLDVRQGYFFTG